MNSELTSTHYEGKAVLCYQVSDVPVRPAPYSSAGARYQPDSVTVTFAARSECSTASLDLAVDSVTVFGHKLKKDGTPGLNECAERLYNYRKDYPDWVNELVEQAKGDLS